MAKEIALLAALRDIAQCAAFDKLDPNLRMAWIGYKAQEAIASAEGNYTEAAQQLRHADSISELMRSTLTATAQSR